MTQATTVKFSRADLPLLRRLLDEEFADTSDEYGRIISWVEAAEAAVPELPDGPVMVLGRCGKTPAYGIHQDGQVTFTSRKGGSKTVSVAALRYDCWEIEPVDDPGDEQ